MNDKFPLPTGLNMAPVGKLPTIGNCPPPSPTDEAPC